MSDPEKGNTTNKSQVSDGSLESESYSCWSVEKPFVPFKIHYFLLNGAHVGVVPYLPVYAKSSLGCSATTVGLLSTCMQFSTTLSKPVFGMLADYLNRMKMLIGILLFLEILVNMLMLVLPPIEVNTENPETSTQHEYVDVSARDARNRLSRNILRYVGPPPRAYDINWGLHLQYRSEISDIKDMRLIHSSQLSDEAHFSSDDYVTALSVRATKSENQKPRARRHANYVPSSSSSSSSSNNGEKSYKCHLKCDDLVPDAECYQSFQYCIDLQSENTLYCSASKNEDAFRHCEGFTKENLNFTLAYRIKSIYSQWDLRVAGVVDVIPDSFVYYEKSSSHWKKHSCNASSSRCQLQCDRKTKFCAKDVDENRLYRTYQFWTFCIFALVSSMCQGALYTLSDTACYEKLRDTKSDFGRQRLWAAVGWGSIAPLTGFLNDYVTGSSLHEDYSSGWYIMAMLSVFFLINLYFMDFPPASESESMLGDVRRITAHWHFVLMEINVFFMGVLNAYATNYVIWYMEMLGSSRMQMGLALAVDCLFGEAPFMYVSGWLISKLGHWHIVTLTFATFGARFGAYYLISDPWMVLPIEILHGITYGLIYTTITSYGEEISSTGTGATIQGILGGTYQGLGSGVGCLVAGISFDRYGGRRSFLLISIFSVCLALCHSAALLLCRSRLKKTRHSLLKDIT